jgi:M6 family metalloprotease-like protein
VRSAVIRHAIEHLDRQISFQEYDNWSQAGGQWVNAGDGVVDMIIACFRSVNAHPQTGIRASGFGFEGEAGLGGGSNYTVDNGGLTVNPGSLRSGVTVLHMKDQETVRGVTYEPRMEIVVHEIGHHLGLQHQYEAGVWTIMGHRSVNVSYLMNSFERQQLGWATAVAISGDQTTVGITDYATTGDAYRLQKPNGTEWFLFENHQEISQYDVVDRSPAGGKGLYIVYKTAGNRLAVANADGVWTWTGAGVVEADWDAGQLLNVMRRTAVHRYLPDVITDPWFPSAFVGFTDRMAVPQPAILPTNPPNMTIAAWIDEASDATIGSPVTVKALANQAVVERHFGDAEDAWLPAPIVPTIPTGSTVFSPWSNPSSRSFAGDPSMLGAEILAQVGTTIFVHFYTVDPMAAPPSKPQDLKVKRYCYAGGWNYAVLTWEANLEPDLASYEIFRCNDYGTGCNYVLIGTVQAAWTPVYLDFGVWEPGGQGDPYAVSYFIKAVDISGLASARSECVSTTWGALGKRVTPSLMDAAGSLAVLPNPTAEVATIVTVFAEAAEIDLSITDVRGRRVASWQGSVKAGPWRMPFDLGSATPGVYRCVIHASNRIMTAPIVIAR